jgi:hypothetical protein
MDRTTLPSPLVRPSIVVAGIPECWVDAGRIARLLRSPPANDNGRRGGQARTVE